LNRYPRNEFVLPSVTEIIGSCNPKDWGPPWGANMVVEWIKTNCAASQVEFDETLWTVTQEDLNSARKHFRDVQEDALDIGSQVHKAVEVWLKHGKEPINPRDEVLAGFVAFLEFYDEHKMHPIELEFTVYGNYWAGTLDYFGWFNDKLYVIDFKTSKAHFIHEHGPQIAAYKSALPPKCWPSFSKGDPLDGIGTGILRLDKSSGYPDFKDYTKRYESDLKEFQLMVPLFLHRHKKIAKAAGFQPPF